jgi:uncharacterized membrane protein YgcG
VDGKPNKKCKKLNNEFVQLVKASSKFTKSFTKIEAMKIEIQKEIALNTMDHQFVMARMFIKIMRGSGVGGVNGGGGDSGSSGGGGSGSNY